MKNIHEILLAYGLTVPEDKKTDFEKELTANYKTIADYEKQTGKVEQLTKDLTTAKEGLKAFEGVDVADLKSQITVLQGKLETSDKEWQKKLADMEFDTLLTGAITTAKGKNAKAIRALLDVEALQSSKNQATDITAALDKLKQDSGYLFDTGETPPPYAGGAGTQPPAGGQNAAMRAAFGLPAQGK